MTSEPIASVDVVIVNYLSGAMLAPCVAMLRDFLPDDANFVFVDNSPADGAVVPAAELLTRSTVLPQEGNVGFAAAVNAGIRAGAAPLILLVNPDVVAVNGDFDDVRDLFDQYPHAGAMTGRVVDEAGVLMHCRRAPGLPDFFEIALGFNRILPGRLRRPSVAMLDWPHDSVREVGSVTGAFLFLRRAAIEEVGGFDERFFLYWEETDWMLRARRRGWSTLFAPQLEVVHLGEASSPASAGHSALFVASLHTFVKKHHGRVASAALRVLWAGADVLRLARSRVFDRGDSVAIRARLESHLNRSRRPES